MRDDKKKLLALSAALLLLTVTLAFVLWYDYRRETLEGERYSGATFCPNNPAELQAHTIFVLDFSDPVTREEAGQIKNRVIAVRENLQVREKLSTLFINAAGKYDELYAVCKPPKPRIRQRNWECGKNLGGIDKAREREAGQFCDFKKQMQQLVEELVDRSKSTFPSSPLIEVLADVSRRNFQGLHKKEIILFSDLMQNTDRYSFFPGRGPVPAAKSVLAREDFHLDGVEINVHQIRRNSGNQTRAKYFWEELFDLAKARSHFSLIQ